MGKYLLSLHGSDGSSDGGGGGHQQSKAVYKSPPRHSTACCDGLSERRAMERSLNAIVPLQDSCSFRSEDSESLALWEEKEQPASNEQGWGKSLRWLEAMRKFDATKLSPWRSSPVHPKTSLDGPRLSLSDSRKGSLKSLHESSKAPWFTNATRKIGGRDSRSVRSPLGASNLSRQSGELIPMNGELLLPHARSGELCRSDGSLLERKIGSKDGRSVRSPLGASNLSQQSGEVIPMSGELLLPHARSGELCRSDGDLLKRKMTSKLGDTRLSKYEVASSKPELAVNAVTMERSSEGSNSARAREEEIRNANLAYLTKSIESVFDNISASRNSIVKAINASTCEPGRSSITHEKVDEATELAPSKGDATVSEVTSREASLQLALRPSSEEQGDDTSPYEALRQRYIQKAESEVWDGNFYVIQRRPPISPAFRAQSFICNSETDSSSESCLLDLKSPDDAEGQSTPRRLFASLRTKVSRTVSPRATTPGKKSPRGDLQESSSPRSILCGLADEGSEPSSNSSLRSEAEMSAFSTIPESASSSDDQAPRTSYSLNVPKAVESRRVSLSFRDFGPSLPSRENAASEPDAISAVKETSHTELLESGDNTDRGSTSERILTPELWTATFATSLHHDFPEVDSPCNTPPPTRLSYVSASELHLSSSPTVSRLRRPRHNDFAARLGGMFSPRRIMHKCDDVVTSSRHSCFVASSTLSPPHDDDIVLGDRSPAYDELLPQYERKSKSKVEFSDRCRSSTDSSDAPTKMISISKAMKKILSKCTTKRSNSKGKSKIVHPPILHTLEAQ